MSWTGGIRRASRLTLAILAVSMSIPAFADDALFDTSYVHEIRITMDPEDWSRLRAGYQSNTYYDADLTIDGETVTNIAVRSRGSGTRNGIKPGLLANIDRNVDDQTFRGFEELVLDNMYNDFSFLRERLSFAVFHEMGIEAPREVFARMYVNGEYWGLYAIVEPVDERFVERFDGGGGDLYEYEVPVSDDPNDIGWNFSLNRGDTLDDYIPEPFDPETDEDELDGGALLAFLRTVSEAPDATFAEEISQFMDPELYLMYFAVEAATAEVDGMTSFFGVNNFYLYRYDGTQRFVFIPWDHDFNFTTPSHGIFQGVERNRLLERLLDDPELNQFYRDSVAAIVDMYVNPAWMFPRIDEMVAQIEDAVKQDTKRRNGDDPTAASLYEAVQHIRDVITYRGVHVDAQLHPERRRAVRR